jgi:UDP-N-acetylglucosamine 1-carboxyvinyltransferase
MAEFVIEGGHRLSGSIPVYGSKNAALPLLAASLLTVEPVRLTNMPRIRDVATMLSLLKELGARVERAEYAIEITAAALEPAGALNGEAVSRLRGSILLLGALLGRFKTVRLPRPGGDIIGARPIDVHLDAFRQLGARIKESGAMVQIDGTRAQAGEVVLREFSVTATENTLLFAATLPGTTTIHVAATEPHVTALANLLNAMGAHISGAGTHTITVVGSRRLGGAAFHNIPDMLEAGLFILLAAATESRLSVEGVPSDDLRLFFKKLDDIGVAYTLDHTARRVTVEPAKLSAFTMQSLPHPGIPTDLQAPFAVLASRSHGTSLIHDPLYEDRFKHIVELQKMGAKAVICDPHRVVIEGPQELTGRVIPGLDIRAGATLIMAGLIAQGETVIQDAEIIERGYADLTERLQALGARISRREADKEETAWVQHTATAARRD